MENSHQKINKGHSKAVKKIQSKLTENELMLSNIRKQIREYQELEALLDFRVFYYSKMMKEEVHN